MLAKYTFRWRDDTYRIDRGTPLFWPRARIVIFADADVKPTLITTDKLYADFAEKLGLIIDEGDEESDLYTQLTALLEGMGHTILDFRQALECILSSPNSAVSAKLIECLLRWYFIARIN